MPTLSELRFDLSVDRRQTSATRLEEKKNPDLGLLSPRTGAFILRSMFGTPVCVNAPDAERAAERFQNAENVGVRLEN